ncbi:translation initiation factor IF-2 [Thiovulum sp. ES]|nr:translation initiation factor IF-2 [Thiovulum sp. ES]
MSNIKITEIAKELGVRPKDVIEKAKDINIDVEKPSDTVSEEQAEKVFNAVKKETRKRSSGGNNRHPRENQRSDADRQQPRRRRNNNSTTPRKEEDEKEDSEKSSDKKEDGEKREQRRERTPRRNPRHKEGENREDTPRIRAPKQKKLKIIKKVRPLKKEAISGNYGRLSEDAKKELTARKSSSANRKSIASKRKNGEELEIFNRDFGDENRYTTSLVKDEEEVVLLDYRDQSLFEDKKDKEVEDSFGKKKDKKKGTGKTTYKKRSHTKQSLVKSVKKRKRKVKNEEDEIVTSAEIPENIRVYEFAEIIKKPLSEVITILFNMGMMVTKNDFLEGDVIEVLADEFNVEVTTIDVTSEFDYVKDYEDIEDTEEDLMTRAPIITIMGHVDHGKTSLLDKIRSSKIASGEAGGITQHIGAYTIKHNEKPITFIDTPGHSAFSEMRKRGAEITDIVIIVVAADDGVKPQTREAVKHAQDSNVPIIVAINKMDKEGANPEMVKGQVAELGLNPVEWGGDTEFIPISAKTGDGIDDILENILIQAEILELQANPNRNGKATIIESTVEKGRGSVATVIVQNGTLRVGDSIVVASHYGKVRSLLNDQKKTIKSIAPGETGVVVGLNGVPASGEDLVVTDSEKEARELAEKRLQYERNQTLSKTTKASLDELNTMIAEGRMETLKIILKADVHGTLQALKSSLEELRNDEVKVNIISEGVGGITENDVILAGGAENIMIVGFNVRPTGVVKNLAEKNLVKLKTYSVIYEVLDDVTNILSGMMKPIEEEEDTGQAEIRQLFKVKEGIVAGCLVVDGAVEKGIFVRLIRNGVVLANTHIHSLKRFKDEVNEVKKGYECGILLKDLNDIAEGDIIETYRKTTKQASL